MDKLYLWTECRSLIGVLSLCFIGQFSDQASMFDKQYEVSD